ncbi:MAG: hypothetical protein Kow0037_19360 [Calditrichia bacterium]
MNREIWLQRNENYLKQKMHLQEKYGPFYHRWVRLAYQQLNLPLNQSLSAEQIRSVPETLSQNHQVCEVLSCFGHFYS